MAFTKETNISRTEVLVRHTACDSHPSRPQNPAYNGCDGSSAMPHVAVASYPSASDTGVGQLVGNACIGYVAAARC